MAREYTHRYASSGIYTQPTSFNYFEPFLHIKLIGNIAPYTEIEPEFNHLFHAEDFFEYVTSKDNDGFVVSSLMDLPQDQIFHFSTNGLVTDISFQNGEGREFCNCGIFHDQAWRLASLVFDRWRSAKRRRMENAMFRASET